MAHIEGGSPTQTSTALTSTEVLPKGANGNREGINRISQIARRVFATFMSIPNQISSLPQRIIKILSSRETLSISSIASRIFSFLSGGVRNINTKPVCSENPSINHLELINLLVKIYPKANREGLCNGFALMGMRAVFLQDEDSFNKRLERLGALVRSGKTYEEIIQDANTSSPRDFDLLAFLEGLHLCMEGSNYPDLVDPTTGPKSQNHRDFTKTFLSMVTSIESKEGKKGEIVKVNNQVRSGVYKEADLTHYFENLRQTLDSPPAIQDSIVIKFGTIRAPHAISVGYDPKEKTWLFIDANNGSIERVKGDRDVAKKVMDGYKPSKLSDESVALSHEMYAINYSQSPEEKSAIDLTSTTSPSFPTEISLEDSNESAKPSAEIKPIAEKSSEILSLEKKENELQGVGVLRENDISERNTDWLCVSAYAGDLASLQECIKTGVNLDVTTEGAPPLYLAAQGGHLDIVKALIDAGANVNAQNTMGDTPLHLAIVKGYTEVALALVEADNINLQIKNNSGQSSFFLATDPSSNNRNPIIAQAIEKRENALIQAKEQLEAQEIFTDPLLTALSNGDLNKANELISNENVNVQSSNGQTPLNLALQKGYLEIARALIKAGADVNIQNSSGNTPLHVAIAKGYTEIALVLISAKNINLKTNSALGISPSAAANYSKLIDVAKSIEERERADLQSELQEFGGLPPDLAKVMSNFNASGLTLPSFSTKISLEGSNESAKPSVEIKPIADFKELK